MGIETGLVGTAGFLILIVIALVLVLYLVPLPLWIAAWASGAYVGLLTLIGMRFRRVPPLDRGQRAHQRGEGGPGYPDQRSGSALPGRR